MKRSGLILTKKSKHKITSQVKTFFELQGIMMLFSFSTVCSKIIGKENGITGKAMIIYIVMLLILGIYAIFWQRIIKKTTLTWAYSAKGMTVVWGLIWGAVFFQESINIWKVAGCCIIIGGILLYASIGSEEKRL